MKLLYTNDSNIVIHQISDKSYHNTGRELSHYVCYSLAMLPLTCSNSIGHIFVAHFIQNFQDSTPGFFTLTIGIQPS